MTPISMSHLQQAHIGGALQQLQLLRFRHRLRRHAEAVRHHLGDGRDGDPWGDGDGLGIFMG